MTSLPNFLIVGAAKCGTTSLYNYLKQHPNIFMPNNKEPSYFSSSAHLFHQKNWISSFSAYKNLFSSAHHYKAIGEASVNYFDDYLTSIPLIKSQLGDPKIIILLKNPLQKTYSSYTHLLKSLVPVGSFYDFIHQKYLLSSEHLSKYNNLLQISGYHSAVKAFLEHFSQVKILFFEEFIKDPIKYTQEVYEFLDVDKNFIPEIKIHNQGSTPNKTFLGLYTFLSGHWKYKKHLGMILRFLGLKNLQEQFGKWLLKFFLVKKGTINTKEYRYLHGIFEKDVKKLALLLKTDKPLKLWGFDKK